MQKPLNLTYKEIEKSAAVSAYVRTRFQKLEKFSDKIIHCHVVIERVQKHQQNPIIHNVKIHLSIPHYDLTSDQNNDENLYKAIQKAFLKIQRQLQDSTQLLEGYKKHHEDIIQGTVTTLFTDRGFGFIESTWGEEYYFSDNNLTGKSSLSRLRIGTHVEFTENQGNEGLQANRVKIKDRR